MEPKNSDEWTLDATGSDSAIGVLGVGEILWRIEVASFERGWHRRSLKVEMPLELMQRAWAIDHVRQRASRVHLEGQPVMKWQGAACDMVIVPVQSGEPIRVFTNEALVGTVKHYGQAR